LKQFTEFTISIYGFYGGDMEMDDLMMRLASPAQRALQEKGIKTLEQLSKLTEEEVFELHGIGKNALTKIKKVLKKNGLALSKE
jgi:DNA-directed RNA polymerase alpha subunit